MYNLFNERCNLRRRQIREWYPRRIKEAGGLSPEFMQAYIRERKLLLGKGVKKENVDRWMSKAIGFHSLEENEEKSEKKTLTKAQKAESRRG